MSDHMTGLVSYKSVISFPLSTRIAVYNFQLSSSEYDFYLKTEFFPLWLDIVFFHHFKN